MPASKSVVISCAGIGSRLGLATTKALIQIDGASLISLQLHQLKDFEDIRVVVGFQADDVIQEVLKYRSDVIFVYNHNYFETKTAASLYLGAKDANEMILEYDGDLLVHPDDLRRCLEFEGEFLGYSDKTSEDAVYVNTNEAGEVTGFSRKIGDYEWTGPACISKHKIKYSTGNVFNQLEEYLPIQGLHIRARDIDTYNDYVQAVEFVRSWNKL